MVSGHNLAADPLERLAHGGCGRFGRIIIMRQVAQENMTQMRFRMRDSHRSDGGRACRLSKCPHSLSIRACKYGG